MVRGGEAGATETSKTVSTTAGALHDRPTRQNMTPLPLQLAGFYRRKDT